MLGLFALAGGPLAATGTAAAVPTLAGAWRPVVTLDGVDVSGSVFGTIQVEAAEDSARVAEFSLLLAVGAAVNLPSFVGKAVVIDYADVGEDGAPVNPVRIFSGVVDLPEFDRATRSIRFVCTDDLPGIAAGTDFAALETLTGGVWSPVVFDESADGWDRARDLIRTVSSSLDLSVYGTLRVTPWASKATADSSFGESDVLDQSLRVQLANRSTLRNRIDVDFAYRFPRLRARRIATSFDPFQDAVDNLETSLADGFAGYLLLVPWFAARETVRSAAEDTGCLVESLTFTAVPPSGVYYTAAASPVAFNIADEVRNSLCYGWTGDLIRSFGQVVEELRHIRVENAASVAAVGAIVEERSAALEVDFDIGGWEAAANSGTPTAPVLSGPADEVALDYFPSTETDRTAADLAITALVREAAVRIHGTHRENAVLFDVPLDPTLDTTQTVEVNAQGVLAKGKCRSVVFTLDLDTGEAVSSVEIAICSLQGVGYSHPNDPTTPPAATTPPAPGGGAIFTAVSSYEWRNAAADHAVEITVPAVEAIARDNLVDEVSQTYAAGIPEDVFTVTA